MQTVEYPYGAGHYRSHGCFLPEDGLERLRAADAILFGAILSGALLLEHRGETDAAARIQLAVEGTLRDGVLPVDLGGQASTYDVTRAVIDRLAA